MRQSRPPILDASAIIFDVDGTLVDSVDFHAEAWQRASSAFGFDFDLGKVRSQIGKGSDQLLPVFLAGDVLEKKGKEIEAYRQDLLEREYFHRVIGFPKVPELLGHRLRPMRALCACCDLAENVGLAEPSPASRHSSNGQFTSLARRDSLRVERQM